MSNMPNETDLKSENQVKFAAAALQCQHPGGFCVSDGFCHYGGDCFRTNKQANLIAIRLIKNIKTDSSKIKDCLYEAAKYLSRMEQTHDKS